MCCYCRVFLDDDELEELAAQCLTKVAYPPTGLADRILEVLEELQIILDRKIITKWGVNIDNELLENAAMFSLDLLNDSELNRLASKASQFTLISTTKVICECLSELQKDIANAISNYNNCNLMRGILKFEILRYKLVTC